MKFNSLVVLIFSLLFVSNIFAAEKFPTSSPVGLWKTIDDVTGQAKSIVQISAEKNGALSGSVVKLFKHPGKRCTKCDGVKQNQPIVGMEILTDLTASKENKGEWVEGAILDPKNGKTYHCSIRLTDQGHKLVVRGFIGLPVFGRSQTWERVEG